LQLYNNWNLVESTCKMYHIGAFEFSHPDLSTPFYCPNFSNSKYLFENIFCSKNHIVYSLWLVYVAPKRKRHIDSEDCLLLREKNIVTTVHKLWNFWFVVLLITCKAVCYHFYVNYSACNLYLCGAIVC